MRMYSASGRSRWPWIIGGIAIVVVAIVGGLAFAAGRGSRSVDPSPAASGSPSPSPSESPSVEPPNSGGDGADEVAPTGCLGGEARDPAMVLAAQEEAPHSMYGAVEVATAYTRWAFQFPYPSDADAATISDAVIAENAAAPIKDIAGSYERVDDITSGNVPAGTPFHLASIGGLWLVSSGSTADRITVSINGNYVIDGALSPTKTSAIGWVMVWEDDAWRIEGAEQPDVAAIAAGGTSFTGGC